VVHEPTISRTCELCAELDCLLSLAEASRAYNYIRPEMSEENIIDISKGRWGWASDLSLTFQRSIIYRHPLQEQVVDSFVPNDAYLEGKPLESQESSTDEIRPNVLVLTGANACGKVSGPCLLGKVLISLRVCT
jgi:DNA mismatch repair protein MSH5